MSKRPQRKDRNRAVIYTLIETGMRRVAVISINVDNLNFAERTIRTEEKGGIELYIKLAMRGLAAIGDYLEKERVRDANIYKRSAAQFLPATDELNDHGRLSVNASNDIRSAVCDAVNVTGKIPHSARHGVGKYLIEKTGNVDILQRQLGHKNTAYSL